MENVVFMGLQRRMLTHPVRKINFWRSVKSNREVDCVISEGEQIHAMIQVCYDLSDRTKTTRKFDSLKEFMEDIKQTQGIIITFNENREEIIEGKQIKIMAFWT